MDKESSRFTEIQTYISIIVPVYNVEKYLSRCVDSILNQTFTDFELILVDDGSTDNSAKICDEYAEKDCRIKVIHKENGGVSSARNVGLENAVGEYIMFCDSDDFVDKDWIKILLFYAKKNPTSLINCEYCNYLINKDVINYPKTYNVEEATHIDIDQYFYFYKNNYSQFVWNRIFCSETIMINDIRFDEKIKVGEDALFILEYLKYCTDFLYIPKCLYYWVNNSESASRKYEPYYYDIIKKLYFPRKNIISEKDKQAFIDEYFHRFYECFTIVFDERNEEPKTKKIKYCNYILNDNEFIDAMNNASAYVCSSKMKKILKIKNYRILKIFLKAVDLKKRRR